MNKENCALKLVDEIILYYDVRSKKHQIIVFYKRGRECLQRGTNFVFKSEKYRVIKNDCRGFNNLSYTIHLR